MNGDVIATLLTGVGVLLGVWRMVESVRRDLGTRMDGVESRLGARIDGVESKLGARIERVESKLGARIEAVNVRIDNVLLADRGAK